VTTRGRQLRWIAFVAAAVFAADQITKAIVRATIEIGTAYTGEVFLRFVHHENAGIVGGAFSNVPFVGFIAPAFAFLVLIYLFRQLRDDSLVQVIGYAMVVGGALGNMTDRVFFGAVTDFIQVHFYFIPFDFPWKYFPTFNIADASIDIGVVLLLITWGWRERRDVARTP
jgi:signal peptidase II